MKGLCRHQTGRTLGAPERGDFYSLDTEFPVEVGTAYPIFGLGIFETVFLTLICDETRMPSWLPIGLFDLQGSQLPPEWHFEVYDGYAASGGDALNRWVARWGYRELVRDPSHSDALIEGDPDALSIFFREVLALSEGETPARES